MEKKVSFTNQSEEKLSGYLHVPEGKPKAGVLLAHCFTCSKHIKIMRRLCDSLATNGFLMLRFDFSGNGESEGKPEESTYSKQIGDFSAAYHFLKSQGIPKIAAVGHSMGSAVTILASAKNDPYAIALVAGESSTAEIKHLFKDKLPEIEEKGSAEITIVGHTFRVTKQFVLDSEKYDLKGTLKQLKIPILFVHGSEDQVVPASSSEENYQVAVQPKRLEIIKGADHMFAKKEHIDRLITVITEWFTQYLRD